jgi:hypothetical protein
MPGDTATQEITAVEESPFHLRGYIGPQHPSAWKAMKWHDDTLRSVFQDLDRDPPEYILVRAPALSGKTTFAMQFLDRAASTRPDILAVYLPLGATTASQQDFLRQVRGSFVGRVRELLDEIASTRVSDGIQELSDLLTSFKELRFGDLEELLRGLLLRLPGSFQRVVLVLDDCDCVPLMARMQIAEALRTIHSGRSTGPLRKFTILLLARSLLSGPQAVSPLTNVVKGHYLADFTQDDLRAFLKRCEDIIGVGFKPDAVEYLYRKAGGHAVLLQRLLKAATRGRRPAAPAPIGLEDALRSVCECYEQGGGVVNRLLDVSRLTDEARSKLVAVLQERPVLAFEFEPAIAELVDLGMVKSGANNRCVCRSPLVRELLVSRHFRREELPILTPEEQLLIEVPSVFAMAASDRLFGQVSDRIRRTEKMGFASGEGPEKEAVAALRESGYPLDLEEIRYCHRRYYSDLAAKEIELDDVFELVAKLLLAWSGNDE